MLEIKITLAPEGKQEARAVIDALLAYFGPDIMPTVNIVQRTQEARQVTVDVVAQGPASDGYPTENVAYGTPEPEPTAAEAFGAVEAAAPVPAPLGGQVGSVERDAEGLPWDERIHASSKTKTAKGNWTRRRNVPDGIFNKIEAELKAAKASTVRTVLAAIPAASVPVPPPPAAPSAAEAFGAVPSPVPAPTGASPAGAFAETMKIITAKALPKDQLLGILGTVGLTSVAQLTAASQDVHENVRAMVQAS